MKKIISRNPFTGTINRQFDHITKKQIDLVMDKALEGLKFQSNRNSVDKIHMLESFAKNLEKDSEKFAKLITSEMGKPITQSKAEVNKVINHAKYYIKHFEQVTRPTLIPQEAKKKTLIKYKPLGIIYYIVPFNFPFWLMFKGGLGSLILGNSLLVRPSQLTPCLGQATQQLMNKSGFQSGQFQIVNTATDQLEYILSNNNVCGVNFTGSSKTGSQIAQMAGKYIKKSVLELGGNDPFIVLKDANIDDAVKGAIRGRAANAGQVCFSPKRFIIQDQVYEQFRDKLVEGLKKVVYGNPLDDKTEMGPLCSIQAHKNLQKQLLEIPSSWNLIYKTDVQTPFFPIHVYEGSDKQPYLQQLFGPIFSLYRARDEAHAVEIANQGEYGLSSTIYSESRDKAEKLMENVRAGMCFINEVPKSDTALPTGGVGKSGYGRECGMDGFREFANVKLYYVS